MEREDLVAEVKELTEMMRCSANFSSLRSAILEKNVDPQRALLASFLEDENLNEYGIIVCDRSTVFEYVRSNDTGAAKGFVRWNKVSDISKALREYPQIEIAFELLQQA